MHVKLSNIRKQVFKDSGFRFRSDFFLQPMSITFLFDLTLIGLKWIEYLKIFKSNQHYLHT